MKVLVKRSIAEDGYPKKDGDYFIEYKDGDRMVMSDSLYSISDTNMYSKGWWTGARDLIIYWYEEIELSKLLEEVMPTEEEKKSKTIELINSGLNIIGFQRRYDEWLKSKLTTKIK